MSKDDAWAAVNLDMPRRIPRTEYSVEGHWDLLAAETGIPVDADSDAETKRAARLAFRRAWDIGLSWATHFSRTRIGGRRTDMGHALYAADGSDWRDTASCPFDSPEEVLAYDPREEAGAHDHAELVRFFDERYAAARAFDDDVINMTGVYVTMFSGLIEVFGWEMLLLAAGTDPAAFGQVAGRWEEWIRPVYAALADCAAPLIMAHDDIVWTAGPVLPPAWYREFVFPAYARLWRPLLDAGKRLLYTSDGDYTAFFDDVVAAGAHGLVMEPCSDLAVFAERHGRTHAFVGNADTRILLKNDRAAIRAEVERCVAIGRDCPGFVMAVGNHIPANTPIDAARYYQEVFAELRDR